MLKDLRFALRLHIRQPGFAATVLCTLAVSIGATTAVFSVVNTVLIRALPFASPDRLVWIASVRADNPSAPFTLPEFIDYRSRTRALSGLAAFAYWSASLTGKSVTERLTGARMSGNTFEVLGMTPVAGRLLNDADDRPDAPPVVLLSYRLWQRRYDGSPGAIGRTARINGASFEIVGVLPPHFPMPFLEADVVTQLAPERDPLRHVRGSVNFLRFFGRLRSDTAAGQAQAELTAICRSLREQFPVEYSRKQSVSVVSVHEALVGDFRQTMFLLLAAAVVVLATALANLVSLALVRANARRAELTVRAAMGASRADLIKQLSVEGVLLAAIGGVLGWLIAGYAIAGALRWAPPSIPRLGEASLDSTAALLLAAIVVVVTVLLTGAPLAVVASARAGDALRGATRGAIGDRWNQRVRNVLVVAEISAAYVLLLATFVLVQNLRQLREIQPGFKPDGVFQARLSIPPTYRSPDEVARFYERLSERIAVAPGVEHLGVISIAPFSGLLATVPFAIPDRQFADRERPSANLRAISPGYLSTVGTRLVQGRSFSEDDRSDTPPVALVSEALADRFLSGRAVGQRLLINDNNDGARPVEVVGVVEDVRQSALNLPPTLDIYLPLRQTHSAWLSRLRDNQFWMVRTASDPAAFRTPFLAHLRAVDPDAAVSATGTMRQFLEESLGPRRFNLGLFGVFALTAVLLAVIGLYGLVSYAVSQREQEIGLRMAIGATQQDVQRMILRQAAVLGTLGATLGLGLAVAAHRLTTGMIEEVSFHAAMVVGLAAGVIAIVVLAAWRPARRAAKIEPTLALKAQ